MIPIKVKNKIFLLKYKVKNMINDLLTFLDLDNYFRLSNILLLLRLM